MILKEQMSQTRIICALPPCELETRVRDGADGVTNTCVHGVADTSRQGVFRASLRAASCISQASRLESLATVTKDGTVLTSGVARPRRNHNCVGPAYIDGFTSQKGLRMCVEKSMGRQGAGGLNKGKAQGAVWYLVHTAQ